MKPFRIIDDEPDLDALGESINAVASMAHLLAATVDERFGQDAETDKAQQEAIAFGAYEVERLAKAVRAEYYKVLKRRD